MNERIKQLRKSKKMNQTQFGKIIGLSQKAVSNLEDNGTVTPRNFNAICEKFNVNPEWLRYGVGEMFLPENVDTYLDRVATEKNLSEEDKALIRSIIGLPPEARQAVVTWAEKLVEELYPQSIEQAKEDERRELESQILELQRRLAELDTPVSKRKELAEEEKVRKILEDEINEVAMLQSKGNVP